MIIISSSLPKSGSTFICNLEVQLLKISDGNKGIKNGQIVVHQTFGSRFFERIGPLELIRLIRIHKKHGSFVIKTHSGPNWAVKYLINSNIAKATYSIRDPRDVLLSAMDHGNASREGTKKASPFFERFTDVKTSLRKVKGMFSKFYRWEKFNKVLIIKYEDLQQDPLKEVNRLITYLGLNVNEGEAKELMEQFESQKHGRFNFNKGIIERYKMEMSPDDRQMCNSAFRQFLYAGGYEIG